MRPPRVDWPLALLTLVATFLAVMCHASHAHGSAEVIERGGYRNAAGELCCGLRDCGVKVGGTIEQTRDGYRVDADFLVSPPNEKPFIVHVNEFVPESEAQPSPDGAFWRCQRGGQRKCFFAPPPNT